MTNILKVYAVLVVLAAEGVFSQNISSSSIDKNPQNQIPKKSDSDKGEDNNKDCRILIHE